MPVENRDGAFRPTAEMGVLVGMDPHAHGGHWVVPISWDSEQQAWVLGEVITATTVRVYERVMPLRMQPRKGQYGSQEFDSFVEKVFHPLLQSETGDSKGKAHASCSPQAEQGNSEEEVELGQSTVRLRGF